jgi:hypothetical protein
MPKEPFEDPLSEADYYWAGLLAADGSLMPPCHIQMRLSDIDAVLQFQEFLGIGSTCWLRDPVRAGHVGKTCLHFSGYSSKVFDRLVMLGITPKKSHTLKVSDRLALSPIFWRGAFDGDGSFTMLRGKYFLMGFCSSSLTFITQFHSFLNSIGLNPTISTRTLKSGLLHYYVQLVSKKTVRFCESVYGDPCTLFFPRKKAIFDRYISL